MLQESVPMARPTCVALFPWSATSSMFPTITSGPGFGVSGLSVCCRGGITNDCGCPLASCVISIGCIAAPTETVPTAAPASVGRPSALANSFETRSRPLLMVSDCALAIVIVMVPLNIEKRESGVAVAHGKIESLTRRELFNYKPVERRAKRSGKRRSVLRDQGHRSGRGPSQQIVKNQNGKERIRSHGEMRFLETLRGGINSIQPVEIEIHRDATVLDDHLLKRAALPLALDNFLCTAESLWRARIRRGKEQEQWKRETDKF